MNVSLGSSLLRDKEAPICQSAPRDLPEIPSGIGVGMGKLDFGVNVKVDTN